MRKTETNDDNLCTVVSKAINSVFDEDTWKPVATIDYRAGIYSARLYLGNGPAKLGYGRSLLTENCAINPAHIAVLGPEDINLTSLIPLPKSEGRSYITDSYAAIWHSDACPVMYLFDRKKQRGIVWFAEGKIPSWELSRPACPLINLSMVDTPWITVHSAAVGQNGHFLMIAGNGNSGKSTAALACARAGWDYAGDDYVLANIEDGDVAPLFMSARLRPAMYKEFQDWVTIGEHTSSDVKDVRHELSLEKILLRGQFRGGHVSALLLVRRSGAKLPVFTNASRGEALNALFLNTNYGTPGPMEVTARKLTSLIGKMPVFHVDTGETPDAIPEAFDRFMQNL